MEEPGGLQSMGFLESDMTERLCSQYLIVSLLLCRAPLLAQLVKNPPAMQETLVQFLGQEDPLEKG